MPRLLLTLRVLTAIAVIVMATLLCWQCIEIYYEGSQSIHQDGATATPVSIFSLDIIAARFKLIKLPVTVCLVVIALTVLFHLKADCLNTSTIRNMCEVPLNNQPDHASEMKSSIKMIRILVLLLSCLFIVLGALNGGIRDVLVKAISICTECIGLG